MPWSPSSTPAVGRSALFADRERLDRRRPTTKADRLTSGGAVIVTRLVRIRCRTTRHTSSKVETGSSGRVANRAAQIETLVQLLMEPAGREARRRAAETTRQAVR
jgi:hypothetical protein